MVPFNPAVLNVLLATTGTEALDWLLGVGTNVAFDWLVGDVKDLTLD